MGQYTGSKTVSFSIKPASIANAVVKFNYTNYAYKNGSEVKPAITVTCNGKELKKGVDYKAVYTNNIYPGKGKVTVTGINNYTSEVTKNYEIAKVSNLQIKSTGTKSLTLSWNKQSNVTGYIVYKYNFSSKKWKVYKTIKGSSNVTCAVKDLKPGLGYKFMVKSYVNCRQPFTIWQG